MRVKHLLLAAFVITAPLTAQRTAPVRLTLDQALRMALTNSPAARANRTLIEQSKANEITANLRPNPTLSWDTQYLPFFSPQLFTTQTLDQLSQFDVGMGYLFERGHKRQNRLQAAQDATRVTSAQYDDQLRQLSFRVAQQFINVLLAESNFQLAQEDLKSFQETVRINQDQYEAGQISKGDLLKIKLQLLQFQTDVSAARLANVQAQANLRQLIGYDQLSQDFEVEGELKYAPVNAKLEDLQALALRSRPDLQAAELGVRAAQSQVSLAKANGKQDLNLSFEYTHLSAANTGSFYFNIPLPVFNRNQGEIQRTQFAFTQSQFQQRAAEDTVMNEVRNAYESLRTSEEIVRLYESGYLQQATESRDISAFAWKQGAATLIDYLDAERSFRATQLQYRQVLANYMLTTEQLRQAVGTRQLP
jgi:outer membrane protein, heavy metal efflux system